MIRIRTLSTLFVLLGTAAASAGLGSALGSDELPHPESAALINDASEKLLRIAPGRSKAGPRNWSAHPARHADQIFLPGYDIAASELPTSPAPDAPTSPSGYRLAVTFDLQLLHEFNLEAAKIWNQLLDCTSGDVEAAREAYRRAEFACFDSQSGATVKNALVAFHARVLAFFQTSFVPEVLEFTPVLHPLLQQVFEEIIAAWFPTEKSIGKLRTWARKSSRSEAAARLSGNILNALTMFPEEGLKPVSLWPLASTTVHAYYFFKLRKIDHTYSGNERIFNRSAAELLFYGPEGNAAVKALFWLFPSVWLSKLVNIPFDLYQGAESIEPPMTSGAQHRLANALAGLYTDFQKGDEAVYIKNWRSVALKFGDIGKHYGITRKALFSGI